MIFMKLCNERKYLDFFSLCYPTNPQMSIENYFKKIIKNQDVLSLFSRVTATKTNK